MTSNADDTPGALMRRHGLDPEKWKGDGSTPARALWRRGTRVMLSADGLDEGLQGQAPTIFGTVVSDERHHANTVMVLRDGMKGAARYHRSFWEVLDRPGAQELDDNA